MIENHNNNDLYFDTYDTVSVLNLKTLILFQSKVSGDNSDRKVSAHK